MNESESRFYKRKKKGMRERNDLMILFRVYSGDTQGDSEGTVLN